MQVSCHNTAGASIGSETGQAEEDKSDPRVGVRFHPPADRPGTIAFAARMTRSWSKRKQASLEWQGHFRRALRSCEEIDSSRGYTPIGTDKFFVFNACSSAARLLALLLTVAAPIGRSALPGARAAISDAEVE
jgi:hypothetical protein